MNHSDPKFMYLRFLAMIATSMALMFVLMYLNSYRILDHVRFSETRLYMTLIMGGSMVVVMLAGVALVRSQVLVDDVDYMQGMIPHHSIAIMTSERAQIEDPRVRRLASQILAALVREIREMDWLIDDIREHGLVRTEAEAAARAVPEFAAAQ